MEGPEHNAAEAELSEDEDRSKTRLQLLLDVFVFQFKLAADGLRDILLSPLSIISAIMGLVAGGDDPYRYFRDLLRFGRRTEIWINLFGYRKHAGTSDDFIAPIKDKVMNEAQSNPWISKAGSELNRTLDQFGDQMGDQMNADKNANKDNRDV